MSTLLRLDSSARAKSISRRLGDTFTSAWRDANTSGEYLYRDLAADPIPHINQAWTELCDFVLEAGITDVHQLHTAARTTDQRAAWATVKPLLTELLAADVVLITTPMYNFSIPAALKAWIDQVTFPKMSLAGKRFVVATARGGGYSPGTPKAQFDYQERYLSDFFAGHFNVTDTRFVNAELVNSLVDPTLTHLRGNHELSRTTAFEMAATLGRQY